MNHTETTAQLGFLKRAAVILNHESPSTAAHLVTVHRSILHEKLLPLTLTQKKEHCPCCGTIRSPALTCTDSQKCRKRRKPQSASAREDSKVIYNCLRCQRQTIQPFRKQPSRNLKTAGLVESSQSRNPTSADALDAVQSSKPNPAGTKSSTDNANSKKRAKARKQQGLLATLAASKRQPSQSSPSFGLLDLLQP
ncbi:hypothetical protein LOZ61_001856 [Ophidiomyces ophidiicola]|nr:hypothetical protein LOZ61_001856 [Ophidiomyces ophidiicola]KAI1930012.1 hypothetical protein LOZ60_001270 [Ophidiomyces ophidiicola]KAI2149686.1 hypothetical protein LOZ27_000840 [Ophidiomyces ophidiicola]KAI2418781.1 hypothetical protein LOY90_000401 [Ophidiomyces ophidiicola]